ncbi:hypothetical protein BDV18DRAFT_167043 [Aspergillus unguis]
MAIIPIWLLSLSTAAAVSFNVPASSDSTKQLSAAPVGVSLEFFTFPEYITDLPSTTTCLQNLKDLSGTWPPLRIGGTTQDRATFDPDSTEAVTYSVDDPDDAPETLTYGPEFMSLAAEYEGSVVIGLNRRLNNIENTIDAARLAVDSMGNLRAIELGNEPNFFSDDDPIADGSWTAEADYASQISWQDAVAGNLSITEIFSAGVYFGTSPMSLVDLTSEETAAGTNQYVKDYCSHNYPQSQSTANLETLMSHSGIAENIAPFEAEIQAANAVGKAHIFGETNSATQGGGGISPTYGAALWIVDYVMQLVSMGTEALYFHQGTIGNCQYCWWGRYTTGAPYYGAYFATMALANADSILPLDDQTGAYAGYAIYADGSPVRVLLYNSEYYTDGTRPEEVFTLTGLSSTTVTAKRLTAPYSTSRVDEGQSPTVAGLTFDGACAIQGEEEVETATVESGEVSFTVKAALSIHIHSHTDNQTINALQSAWIWIPWTDSEENTAGRIVRFSRVFSIKTPPSTAVLHFSADTRYKLFVNGTRVAVGPTKGSPAIWYYDTLDLAPYLQDGENEIRFDVVRYFFTARGAMPFQRTAFPGLTVVGEIGEVDVGTVHCQEWSAQVDMSIRFPMGLLDDPFLHINERVTPVPPVQATPVLYNIKTLNGELPPWRLRPRPIPMHEGTNVKIDMIRSCDSPLSLQAWTVGLSGGIILPANSSHTLDLQADVHSTAFLRWTFHSVKPSSVHLKVTYSEGYELDPRAYPFFRTKGDRLDSAGHIIGPFDDVLLNISGVLTYEPFWFRTFRLMRMNIVVGDEPVVLSEVTAMQVNYPLNIKASFQDISDPDSSAIWDVSVRTLRNCMFDGYSDCPFYEQLQYSGDSRSVALFHYYLSGDDRLLRQAITNYAASITSEGLTQSRFPSHVPQVIAGFSLYWVLMVCDHHLFFGDTEYTKTFLPRIDGVLDFFDQHVDSLGLVSGLPEDVWQYVDWVTTWGATATHADKGVPTSGRQSNRHTYFSLLYAWVLQRAAQLVKDVGRPGHAEEYLSRAAALQKAVREHCYDGRFFTDSTADCAGEDAYSQHCQVFAIISGTALPEDRGRLLTESFSDSRFSKCSYMMRFYAFRAFSIAGDALYEEFWKTAWDAYRKMLRQNLSTWEEDDVRQRSDCHAWGSVPIYEYCAELAGMKPLEPGCRKILFKPRIGLRGNRARVTWSVGKRVELTLDKAVEVVVELRERVEYGVVDRVELVYS